MRSGGDPAIPARIDRPKTARTCGNLYKNRATFRSAGYGVLPARRIGPNAAFFGSCLRLPQAASIASPAAFYYNSKSVKPWDRAQGDATAGAR